MAVVDFEIARFSKDGFMIAKRLIDEAEEIMEQEPVEAGRIVVRAWVVLNASSVMCRDAHMATLKAKIEAQRNRIRAMRSAFAAFGLKLQTDIKDSETALVITKKNPEELH